MGPGTRTKQGLDAGWGPFGQKPLFLGTVHRRVPGMEVCGLGPANSVPPWGEGHSPEKRQSTAGRSTETLCLGLSLTLPWQSGDPTVKAPRAPHCLQALPWALSDTHTASALSTPQPHSTPAIAAVSSGSKFGKKLNLLCAELWVVLGSGLALALGANTDIHTRLQERRGVWGCVGETDLSFLPLRGWNLPSTQEEKPKAFRSRTGGKLAFPLLLCCFPEGLPRTAERVSLPPLHIPFWVGFLPALPSQITGSPVPYSWAPWMRDCVCGSLGLSLSLAGCAWLCLSASVYACVYLGLCVLGKGPGYRQITQDVRDPTMYGNLHRDLVAQSPAAGKSK